MKKIECKLCGLPAGEIKSVQMFAKECGMTPEEFIIENEGTYNSKTGLFYCDYCYIEIGLPLGKA